MNTQDLIKTISETYGISGNKASKIIHTIVDETRAAVAIGDSVRIAGLGTFTSSAVPERTVHTPVSGSVTIPAHRRVKFRASSMFKDSLK